MDSSEPTTKACSLCGTEKTLRCFGKKDPTVCNLCAKVVAAYTLRDIRYKRIRKMVSGAKRRAEKFGIPFNLVVEDLVIPDVCPITNVPFDFQGRRETAPSLDRLVPSLGYTKENTRIISVRINRIKSDATLDELMALVDYVREGVALGTDTPD
jgi:hypothetical protein